MLRQLKLLGLFSFCMFIAGCMQYTGVYTLPVEDMGEKIETHNKYKIADWGWRYEGKIVKASKMCQGDNAALEDWMRDLASIFYQSQPKTFSVDGIPIEICQDSIGETMEETGRWTLLFSLSSAFILPCYTKEEKLWNYDVALFPNNNNAELSFAMDAKETTAISLSPIALLMPMDEYSPKPEKRNFIVKRTRALGNMELLNKRMEAFAYGVAVKLKELEDSGKNFAGEKKEEVVKGKEYSFLKTENPQKNVSATTTGNNESSPAYNILMCKRELGNDFSYRFELELLEKNNSLRTFRAVQREFRQAVKDDFTESTPGVNRNELYVEFSEYELNNGKIIGRAVVLTISVASLAYDPNTRTGKLAVKVNANQYEEARKWVRKNIETLARDKNIALVTGEIPPAAKFYLGREEFKDGNILEVEFRTE